MTLPIRARLTLWYLVVLAFVLALLTAGVYLFVAAEEQNAVDRILHERVESFARDYASELAEEPQAMAILEVARTYARDEGDLIVFERGKLIFRSQVRLIRTNPTRRGVYTIGDVRCIGATVGDYIVVSTESLTGRHNALGRLIDAFIVVIPIALLIAAFGGYFLAGRSLAPLNAALHQLERSVQQQKQLLADTSHELRTPAAIIRTEAEVTLSRERSNDEYRRALDVIRSESSHLAHLLDSVLLLARADAQQVPVEKEALDLATVVRESVQALRRLAESREVAITCASNGAMPMRGNFDLLRRMMLNLLSNAIRFTDAGGGVCVETRRDGPNYIVTIRDTGRGIPASAQEKIFDRFFRADAARSSDHQRNGAGAGLGLPIARWIARAHGGDLRLVSSSDAGSVFEVALPVSESGAAS